MSRSPVQIDQASDTDLRRRIRNQLSARPSLQRIQIDVFNGIVALGGTVPSIHDRRLATYGCRRVAGVRTVDNQIVVNNQDCLYTVPPGQRCETSDGRFTQDRTGHGPMLPRGEGIIPGNSVAFVFG